MNQQARDGCVAIGKMKKVFFRFFVGNGVAVHSLARRGIQLQAVETRQIESPRILRRNRVNADTEQSVRQCLIHLYDVFMHASDIFQKFGIADPRQLCLLLIRSQTREVIFGFFVEALQVDLGLIRNRSLGEKLLQQHHR